MFGDMWSGQGNKARTRLLNDFDQAPDPKKYKRLSLNRREILGQAESLIRIERFVDYVLRSKSPACKFRKKAGAEFSETRVGKRLRKLYPLHHNFGSRHVYSEKPAVFLRACWQANRILRFSVVKPVRDPYSIDLAYAEAMNFIVDEIRCRAKENWFKREATLRRYNARRNGIGTAKYIAAVINLYARTEIIRLDFGYVGGASSLVSIDRVWSDFSDFLDLFDYHPLFEHMTGYVWSIEQGEDKGFHIHLALLFNGSEVCQDIVKAKLIGEQLWVDRITQGMGTYYNCNLHKYRYDEVGIGTIHRNNAEECRNAIQFLQYLPKGGKFISRDDQYLRIKNKATMRTFGRGHAPEIKQTRAGRPVSRDPCLEPNAALRLAFE